MPVAVVQDWIEEETERSTAGYDAISERLRGSGEPIKGLLMHSAGFTGKGFRISEVWEAEEDFRAFTKDRLMPILAEIYGQEAEPPTLTIYDLHGFDLP